MRIDGLSVVSGSKNYNTQKLIIFLNQILSLKWPKHQQSCMRYSIIHENAWHGFIDLRDILHVLDFFSDIRFDIVGVHLFNLTYICSMY